MLPYHKVTVQLEHGLRVQKTDQRVVTLTLREGILEDDITQGSKQMEAELFKHHLYRRLDKTEAPLAGLQPSDLESLSEEDKGSLIQAMMLCDAQGEQEKVAKKLKTNPGKKMGKKPRTKPGMNPGTNPGEDAQ